jgi:L-threonylcarbamoyladenylate synthase
MALISKDIDKAVALLKNNKQVAIPTETVYGLAGNIFSEQAIRGIFENKKRPLYNPLIVHIHSVTELEKYARTIPEKALQLAHAFWPGSLTLVLPKKDHVPDLITAGKDTVALRVPNHPVTLALLEKLDFPLAAPSANPFGSISPTTAQHVASYFPDHLELILDGGPCQKGIESTIVGFDQEKPVIYRLGSISVEEIEAIVGPISILNKKETAPDAPGMLSRHYAPNTTTVLVEDVHAFAKANPTKKIGVLSFTNTAPLENIVVTHTLSPSGNLEEAMAALYAALHALDKEKVDIIVAQQFPNNGLGRSINDRLQRATKKE